jgi:lysophospholipase L1-like esterase
MISRRQLALLPAAAILAGGAARHVPLAAIPISRLTDPAWRARHEAKLAALQHGPYDLVLLGDSITQNWEKPEFHAAWEHYYGGRRALNLGFKGDATSHLLWRMQNGELAGISPRAAVILIGANNLGRLHWSAADTLAGIDAIVQEARRRLPQTKLLLLGVLPCLRGPWVAATTREINAGLASRYGAGAAPDVTYLDVSPLFMRGGEVDSTRFYDPLLTPPEPALHPTPAAQGEMAAMMEPALARMLGDRPRVATR